MTTLDGFLMIVGFALGCLPVIQWFVQRGGHFKRPRPLAPSPWI